MTAQAMDAVFVDGAECTLICMTGSSLFDPEEWGMPLDYFTTANRKGYVSCFEIAGGRLFLRDLGVYSRDGVYPVLNGRRAVPSEDELDELRWYSDVRLPIDYTGVLVLGDDETYSQRHYVHMGTQAMLCWGEVFGVELVGGEVVEEFPLSDLASYYREILEACDSEREAARICDLCGDTFGFMAGVDDGRRKIVDRYLASEFAEEVELCDHGYEREVVRNYVDGGDLYRVYKRAM